MDTKEKEIRDQLKGRVSKYASFFEEEIRKRNAEQEKLNLKIKPGPKGGRFKGRAPKQVGGRLAALLANFEGNNLNASAKFGKYATGKKWKAQAAQKGNVNSGQGGELAMSQVGMKFGKANVASGKTASGADMKSGAAGAFGNAAQSTMVGTKSGTQAGKFAVQKGVVASGAVGVKKGTGVLTEDGTAVEEQVMEEVAVTEENLDVEMVDFTAEDAQFAALALKAEDALYTATVLYDFDAEEATELGVEAGAQVEVFEVTEDGWALVRHNGKVGWVPLNYLRENPKVGVSESKTNEHGEDIMFNALRPNMEIRETVLRFISQSALFSEARIVKEIEVYIDDIDALLKEGRTVAGTLACLLGLDDQRRKFDNFEELAAGIKELRASWDPAVDESASLLAAQKAKLFKTPSQLEYDRILGDKVLMESTSGGEGLGYLQALVAKNVQANSLDDLIQEVQKLHSATRAARDKNDQDIKKAILAELQDPNTKLFAAGFIDLDMRSLEQMIVRGFTAEDIIKGMRDLNAQGKTYEAFGQLMGAVYEAKKGAKAPPVVVREYAAKLKKAAGSLVSLPATDAFTPQQKVDLIMKFVAKPGCKIFSESKGNIRIRVEDLQRLITSNDHVTTVLADIIFMNHLNKKFGDFGEIANAQKDADVLAAKQRAFDFLRGWDQLLKNQDFKMPELEFAVAQSEFFGDPMYLLTSSQLAARGPFSDIATLGEEMAKTGPELIALRKVDQDKVLSYLGKNAMFSVSVQVYMHYIDSLIDSAGYSGDNVARICDDLRKANQRFTSFEDLIRAVRMAHGG